MSQSNRWMYFDTTTREICIQMGRGMRNKKTEFSYRENNSAKSCCKIDQSKV